jgi:hypothetical protein
VIAAVVGLHIWALHVPGNNNPTGVSVKSSQDTVPFHPYYTMKDGFAIVVFLILYGLFVFFQPNYLGDAINYAKANPLQTPTHIVPEWYYLPFYAILRAITFNIGPLDAKLLGVMAMFSSILILFFLPWLDRSPVKSIRYRGVLYKRWLAAFVVSFLILGYLGVVPITIWGQFPDSWPLLGSADRATVVAFFARPGGGDTRELAPVHLGLAGKDHLRGGRVEASSGRVPFERAGSAGVDVAQEPLLVRRGERSVIEECHPVAGGATDTRGPAGAHEASSSLALRPLNGKAVR